MHADYLFLEVFFTSMSVFDPEDIKWAVHEQLRGNPDGYCTPEEMYEQQMKYAKERVTKGFCEKDCWDIGSWFLTIIPEMLRTYKENRNGSPGKLGENYVNEQGFVVNDTCHAEWDKTLDEMIRLFREAVADTCSRTNLYEDEYLAAYEAFTEKYGAFGERLGPQDDDGPCKTMHFMSEVPEFAGIYEKWNAAERELDEYREECRKQAMTMFSLWLPDVVD